MTTTDPIALRSTYANGRYRPITKAQSAEFKKRVFAVMEETGLPMVRNGYDRESWVFPSRFGPFRVTWPLSQGVIWTVWTRFEADDLTALETAFPLSAHFPSDPNTYSGKWNVHSSVAEAAIQDLRYQLRYVGALPPNEVERRGKESAISA